MYWGSLSYIHVPTCYKAKQSISSWQTGGFKFSIHVFQCRRIVWNFFRVENEHVNNVGRFRAVRDISLYPVDLSKQTEQEVNDESTDGHSKKQLTRKLSNALQEARIEKHTYSFQSATVGLAIPQDYILCDCSYRLSPSHGVACCINVCGSTIHSFEAIVCAFY